LLGLSVRVNPQSVEQGREKVNFAKSKRRHVAVVAMSALPALGIAVPHAYATTLYWDADGAAPYAGGAGGAGGWSTANARWVLNSGDTSGYQPWVNANVDSAVFETPAGQVNIAGPLTVNLITTKLSGYNIGNGNSAGAANRIDFSGADSGIFTDYAGGTTTLSANFTGILNKTGAGRVELGNGTNPNSVRYVLKGGALTSASMARISASAPGALVPDFFTFDGGGWAINTGSQDTGANRGLTIKAGGAFFSATSLTGNLATGITISSPIVGTEGGGITITGAGPFTNNAHTAGANVVLNNTANSWDGPTTVTTGKLTLAQSGVIPDGSLVTLNGGSATVPSLDVNGKTETIGALAGGGTSAGHIALGTGGVLTVQGNSEPTAPIYSGVISGAGDLVKTGPGTQEIAGGTATNSTYTGSTFVEDGILRLRGANNKLPTSTVLTIGAATTSGKLHIGVTTIGRSQTLAGLQSTGLGGTVANGATTLTQTSTLVINNTNDYTYSGALGGPDTNENSLIVQKDGTGTQTLSGLHTYTKGTIVNAGTLQVARLHEDNPVTINGGTLRVLESAPDYASGFPSGDNAFVSRPSSLTVADGAVLDITNNDVIIDYTGASPIAAYEALVASGYNVVGDWAGDGITSSIAAIDGNYVVAIADNAALPAPFGTAQGGGLFSGVDVDLDTILIKFTHRADVDLDGAITPNDASIFGTNYSENDPATWAMGDMDYDGIFTPNDASIFGTFYDESLGSLPEPAGGAVLAVAALAMVRRRNILRGA
jgi:autotransporter-associated beta strand protein